MSTSEGLSPRLLPLPRPGNRHAEALSNMTRLSYTAWFPRQKLLLPRSAFEFEALCRSFGNSIAVHIRCAYSMP